MSKIINFMEHYYKKVVKNNKDFVCNDFIGECYECLGSGILPYEISENSFEDGEEICSVCNGDGYIMFDTDNTKYCKK